VLSWSGVVAGAHPPQVAKLNEFAEGRTVLPIDMSEVERIDFVGAGALYNVVKTIERNGKAVQIFGATPIIRAMMLLIGIAPGHFYKKTSP
jgi:anti-anti-sigma regulatory factor